MSDQLNGLSNMHQVVGHILQNGMEQSGTISMEDFRYKPQNRIVVT